MDRIEILLTEIRDLLATGKRDHANSGPVIHITKPPFSPGGWEGSGGPATVAALQQKRRNRNRGVTQ